MGRKKQAKMPKEVRQRIREGLKEGKLEDFGYKMDKKQRARRLALAKAVKVYGASSVFKSLVLLKTWNKNLNPELARIAQKDATWLGRTYGIKEDGFSFQRD
jgi:hypothetical protein